MYTIQHPACDVGCKDVDCRQAGCKGNRIEYTADGGLQVTLPHHKNERRWVATITFKLPLEVCQVMHPLLEWGHRLVTEWDTISNEDRQHPFLFVDDKGRQFTDATFCLYWKGLLEKAGSHAQFPPQRLRHIFVDERRGADRVAGPSDRGAAMVMGNSERTWDAIYDIRFHRRHAQHAVDAMTVWRSSLLGHAN